MVDDDESSSVQPAPSNISSNVGKGPQQPSIADDNEKMMVDNDESNSLQTLINTEARSSSFLQATSSSSEETALLATTVLPATSSNANSSCTDIMDTVILSSDYNQIAIIADQIFSDIGADNFSGSVLCLYAQALRTHFMTHTHFKRRDTYKRLNAVTTYKQHKDFFFMLAGDFTIADVRANLPSFDGLRTIEHAMRSMLPDRDFTFLNGFELPYIVPGKYSKEVEKDAVNAMNKAFSQFLDQKISSTAEVKVDLSLLLVDFKDFDRSKGTPCVPDFPNRIVVSLEKYPRDIYAYQTVGGLYKKFDSKGDIFAMRIVSRERMGGEYVVHQYFSNNNTSVPIGSKQLSYIDEWESEPYYVTLENPRRDKKECSRSHFPAIINVSKSEKFYLTGAVLCLNQGQEAGLTASKDVLPDVQNSLSQLDPVIFSCCGNTIFAREIRICHDTRKWFSDEIMLPAAEKFLVKRTTEHQDQDQSRIVFVKSTHALTHAVLQHLVVDESVQKRGGRKNTTHKMGEGQANSSYEESKVLWEYKNIFELPEKWFISIINYPTEDHWMLIGILACRKTFFIYDPMHDKGQKTSVINAMKVYIDLEAEAHAASTGVDINTLGEAKDWNYSDCNGQVQYDMNTCGVLVLLAFFRAVDHVSCNKPFQVVAAKWHCSMVDLAIAKYRNEVFHVLADVEDTEDSEKRPIFPRPSQGRRYAGYLYFRLCLIPALANKGNSDY